MLNTCQQLLDQCATAGREPTDRPQQQCPNGRTLAYYANGVTYCYPDDGVWIADNNDGYGAFIPGLGNKYFTIPTVGAYKGDESIHFAANEVSIPATWMFPQLPEGDYDLYGTWVVDQNNDYCAPFSVHEKTNTSLTPISTLGTWRVSENQMKVNLTYNGTQWQFIGTVHTTGQNPLSVTVEACGGSRTVADAVMLHALKVPFRTSTNTQLGGDLLATLGDSTGLCTAQGNGQNSLCVSCLKDACQYHDASTAMQYCSDSCAKQQHPWWDIFYWFSN